MYPSAGSLQQIAFAKVPRDFLASGGLWLAAATPAGRLQLQALAAVAEFETAIRRERQMDGIARAEGAEVEDTSLTFKVDVLEGSLVRRQMAPASIFIDTIGMPRTPMSLRAWHAAYRGAWHGAAAAGAGMYYNRPYSEPARVQTNSTIGSN